MNAALQVLCVVLAFGGLAVMFVLFGVLAVMCSGQVPPVREERPEPTHDHR